MTETLKRVVAPILHIRKYRNVFWIWVDKIEKAHLWRQTADLYGVDGVDEYVTLHSMIAMTKKNTLLRSVKVSEEFHAQFLAWTEELAQILLIPDTLKLHKIAAIDLLEPRLFHLRKISSQNEKKSVNFCPIDSEILGLTCSQNVTENATAEKDDPEVELRVENLISMRKGKIRRTSIDLDAISVFNSLAGVNMLNSIKEETPILEPTNPAFEVPPSFTSMFSNHHYENTCINLKPNNRMESLDLGPDIESSIPVKLPDLKFPFKGDPFETIRSVNEELFIAKLSLYPEAWLVKHFYVCPWEIFNFGEDAIGNFVIAPNYLRGEEDESPNLDLFLWSGEPDDPTFYAFPIARSQRGFYVNESEETFTSLASLVAHYSFNPTEDLPVLLRHRYLTDLVPSIPPPSNLTLQESYLIHVLECTTDNWLTHDVVDSKSFENASSGAFKVQENLDKGSAKLFVKINNTNVKSIVSYEINAYVGGFGIANSEKRFPTLASLVSHYCCWNSEDIACRLQFPHGIKDADTADRMLEITNMVEEVYIARALSLNPQSWYGEEMDPNSHALRDKLLEKPIGNFAVTEFRNIFTLSVHREGQNSPIVSYQIKEIDSNFTINRLGPSFPSIPLLMGYLCRNQNGLLATLLSISRKTLECSKRLKSSFPFEQGQEEFFKKNFERRSMQRHKSSAYSIDANKEILDKMQHFVLIFSRNPTAWRFSEIPEAVERVKQLRYKSFVVTPSNSPGKHILIVRSKESDPEVVSMFNIYHSESGDCGFEKEKLPFSNLEMLLAQSCCVKVDKLPFILNSHLNY